MSDGVDPHQGLLGYSMVPPVTTPDVAVGAFNPVPPPPPVNLDCIDDRGASCNAGIRYTDDGTDPLTSITVQTGSGPISINVTKTIKFYSVDDEGTQETVKSARYAIDGQAPVTTADPDDSFMLNTASGGQVSLLCTDNGDAGCDSVYYTTDGSTPTVTPADLYSGPVTLPDGSSTLKFFAVDLAGNAEVVNTANYNADLVLPVVTPSHLTGTYTGAITVTLSCDDFSGSGCNMIYYTLDGNPPFQNGAINPDSAIVYDPMSPLRFSSGTMLRVYATDMAGNGSAVTNTVDEDIFVYTFTDPASDARQHTGAGALGYAFLLILLLPVYRNIRSR